MQRFTNVCLAFTITLILVLGLAGCGKAPLTEETFKKVVENHGYTTSTGDDGEIDAEKGLSSISFHQYETVEESNEVSETERSMFEAICEDDKFEFVSYGDACYGAEADALIMLTAHKDNTSAICIAPSSYKFNLNNKTSNRYDRMAKML